MAPTRPHTAEAYRGRALHTCAALVQGAGPGGGSGRTHGPAPLPEGGEGANSKGPPSLGQKCDGGHGRTEKGCAVPTAAAVPSFELTPLRVRPNSRRQMEPDSHVLVCRWSRTTSCYFAPCQASLHPLVRESAIRANRTATPCLRAPPCAQAALRGLTRGPSLAQPAHRTALAGASHPELTAPLRPLRAPRCAQLFLLVGDNLLLARSRRASSSYTRTSFTSLSR